MVIDYLKEYWKVILFFMVFAVVQFYFFWALCHLMPGDRLYQRKAKMKARMAAIAGTAAPAIAVTASQSVQRSVTLNPETTIENPIKKSQVPDWKR